MHDQRTPGAATVQLIAAAGCRTAGSSLQRCKQCTLSQQPHALSWRSPSRNSCHVMPVAVSRTCWKSSPRSSTLCLLLQLQQGAAGIKQHSAAVHHCIPEGGPHVGRAWQHHTLKPGQNAGQQQEVRRGKARARSDTGVSCRQLTSHRI